MEMMKAKGSKAIVWTTALCAFGLVVGLSACAPNADKAGRADQKATDKPVAQQVEQTPDADKYGVVHADQWAGDYPYQIKPISKTTLTAPRASTITCSCILR
ncbi:hypothetical protein [Senegalimassilia anaerobia]